MDQLKVILAAIKKHHFWVLGGVVLILLLGVWWQATSGLAKQYEGRKGTLKGHFQKISTLAGAVDPPNAGVIEAIGRVHDDMTKDVLEAWKFLYKQQQDKNRLPEDLGPEFISVWNSLQPDDPIPDEFRDIYWTFITNYLPTQCKRAHIRRPKDGEAERRRLGPGLMPEGGPAGTENIEYVGKVVWDQQNYDQLRARFNWRSRPTTQQIRLAQEDLWVYDTLLNIVRDLNEGARSHYNAPVKRIAALDIGREAANAFAVAQNALGLGSLQGVAASAAPGVMPTGEGMPQVPPAGPGMMGEGGMGPGMASPEMMNPEMMGPGMMMPGAAALGEGLLAGRYVDENAQPVPIEQGVPKQPYTEFKMMPIRFSLVMDQRKIPELMGMCADSNMPIKIRQLRLSPGRTAKVDYAGSVVTTPGMNMMPSPASPYGPGNFSMGMEEGGIGGPGATPMENMMPGPGGVGGLGQGSYVGPYDMPVEILGIIYIYNPADPLKLGKGTAATQPGTGPAVTPATPATIPGTTPAVPPGTTPAVPPGTTPAVPPGTTPATTPATKPGTAPAEAPAKG